MYTQIMTAVNWATDKTPSSSYDRQLVTEYILQPLALHKVQYGMSDFDLSLSHKVVEDPRYCR